ncbi:DUF5610 domain-containing protein [Marinagarivorans algicola]|uniref:DUF5610 domain-containing protein n=1 Tax=Marinagarivorans algicola TaxID=1513270 RepID=UPI00373692CC
MNITTHYSQLAFQQSSQGIQPLPSQAKAPVEDEQQAKPSAQLSSSVNVTLSQASMRASSSEAPALGAAEASAATQTAKATSSNGQNNAFASTILSAIEGQLGRDVADGSSPEELQSRLESGLEGFLQGFDEAFEQLSAMSEFTGEIRSDILQTKEQVLAGLADKADELGLDSTAIKEAQAELVEQQSVQTIQSRPEPTPPAAPVFGAQNLASFSGFAAQENTFAFSLTTADGDKIDILASALKAGEFKQGEGGSQVSYAEQNTFAFSVNGELDEDELNAINDLLGQVNNVAESFFGGNLEQAFDQAMNMGFDTGEIKDFSLKLTQTSNTQVQSAYDNPSQAAKQPSANQPLVDLGHFMIELDKANQLAEQMHQDLAIVGQLADRLSEMRNPNSTDGSQTKISDFINRIGDMRAD